MRWFLLCLIRLYRRYLSPYKGFSCAYRCYGRGVSCSAFAERVLRRGCGLEAVPLIRRRLDICRSVHHAEIQHTLIGARWQGQRGDCDLPFFDCGDGLHVFDSDLMKGKARMLRGCIDGGDCLSGIFDLWPKKKDKQRATDKIRPRRLRRSHGHRAGFCDDALGCAWIFSEVVSNGYLLAKKQENNLGNGSDGSDAGQGGQVQEDKKSG